MCYDKREILGEKNGQEGYNPQGQSINSNKQVIIPMANISSGVKIDEGNKINSTKVLLEKFDKTYWEIEERLLGGNQQATKT